MRLKVNDVHINYRIDGPDGAPWVTMSNSLATTHRMWDAQMDAFTREYRVLRYDKRGHGQSDVAPGPYSFELLADDVQAPDTETDEEPLPAAGGESSGMPDAGPQDDSATEEVLIGSDVIQDAPSEPVHETAPLLDEGDEPSAA